MTCATGTNRNNAASDGPHPNAARATSGVKAPPMAMPITGTKENRSRVGRVSLRPKGLISKAAKTPTKTIEPKR